MRRIPPLVAMAAALVTVPVTACADSARPIGSPDTVAVGTLPATLPTTPSAAADRSSVPSSDAAPTDDASPRSILDEDPVRTTSDDGGAGTARTTEPASTTGESAPPATTRLVVELDRLVEGDVPAAVATTTLRDDTGRLGVSVPTDWSDHRTEPSRLPDGGETPALAAAPDLTSFFDGYGTPGLTALVVADDPADALGAYTFAEDCLPGRDDEYRGDGLAGRYEVWESCGGTINDIVTIAVRPDGAAGTVLLLAQIVGPEDLVALDTALASLSLRD
jgi:hypothetical protein